MEEQGIQCGNCAAGTIGIDERNALFHSNQQRNQRVKAADFNRDGVIDSLAFVISHLAQMIKCAVDIGSDTNFFELSGCAHCCGACSICVFIHFFNVHYLDHQIGIIQDAMVFLELIQCHFAAGASAAATTAENGCTINHVANTVTIQIKHTSTSY